MPGSSGVLSGVVAFAQDWLVTPKGQPALVWVFLPESQVAACLRRIERERVECLLVLPTGLYFGSSCCLVWDGLYGRRCRCHFAPMSTGLAAKHRGLGATRSASSRL